MKISSLASRCVAIAFFAAACVSCQESTDPARDASASSVSPPYHSQPDTAFVETNARSFSPDAATMGGSDDQLLAASTTPADATLAIDEVVDSVAPDATLGIDRVVDPVTRVRLDLSMYHAEPQRVPLFVPHNSLLTFSVDGKSKSVTALGKDTVVYRASKVFCDPKADQAALDFFGREADATQVPRGPGRRLIALDLIVPLQMTPPATYRTSVNGWVCFGSRDASGWNWSSAPQMLASGKDAAFLSASFKMDQSGVDAIALMFSSGTVVQEIGYVMR